jgi:hypothetical protein
MKPPRPFRGRPASLWPIFLRTCAAAQRIAGWSHTRELSRLQTAAVQDVSKAWPAGKG